MVIVRPSLSDPIHLCSCSVTGMSEQTQAHDPAKEAAKLEVKASLFHVLVYAESIKCMSD